MSRARRSHELKLRRAHDHLKQLESCVNDWLSDRKNYTISTKTDRAGYVQVYVTVRRPPEELSVALGDCLQNMRNALDHLAFELAGAFTKPLPDDVAESSEFPIFGDEDRKGTIGVGYGLFHERTKKGMPTRRSGLHKIRGIDPKAQTVIEGLQPYTRGGGYASHPLWVLHELSRIDKHRVIHTAIAHSEGFGLVPSQCKNLSIRKGKIQSLGGPVKGRTLIARIPARPTVPNRPVHVEARPALQITLQENTPVSAGEEIVAVVSASYNFIVKDVLPPLWPYL